MVRENRAPEEDLARATRRLTWRGCVSLRSGETRQERNTAEDEHESASRLQSVSCCLLDEEHGHGDAQDESCQANEGRQRGLFQECHDFCCR